MNIGFMLLVVYAKYEISVLMLQMGICLWSSHKANERKKNKLFQGIFHKFPSAEIHPSVSNSPFQGPFPTTWSMLAFVGTVSVTKISETGRPVVETKNTGRVSLVFLLCQVLTFRIMGKVSKCLLQHLLFQANWPKLSKVIFSWL